MRILHFTDGFLPFIGGGETLIRNLCQVQRARCHTVAIAAGALPGCAREDLIDGVPVFRRRAADEQILTDPSMLARFVEDAKDIKRRLRPDVVHVHGSALSAWINHLSARSLPVAHATIVTLHARLRIPEQVQRQVLAAADAVTAVSESMKEEFSKLASIRSEPICVVHNAIAVPPVEPTRPYFKPVTALCYGRLVHDKGFDVALRALAEIPECACYFCRRRHCKNEPRAAGV